MCGILGATARFIVDNILIDGLQQLEYRGYDSCGIAVIKEGQFQIARSIRRIDALKKEAASIKLNGQTGIAHTRWATHGAASIINAHPIISNRIIAVVHNGIIENFQPLKSELQSLGFHFNTQTDTEVIAHLIYHYYKQGESLTSAVHHATKRLQGAYAIAVMSVKEPTHLIGVRAGSPLIVGIKENAHFLASDVLALSGQTEEFIFLEDGDIAELTPTTISISNGNREHIPRSKQLVASHREAIELGHYRHFMQKEIFEQPRAIAETLSTLDKLTPIIFGHLAENLLPDVAHILILACGTSFYAGLCAKYWIEELASIPTQVEIASEYRYRTSVFQPKTLVIVVSQSGETADTIAALKHATYLGHTNALAICNVASSTMLRMTNLKYLTRAGTEVGVASTKAFTTQLTALFLFAATLASVHKKISNSFEEKLLTQLRHLPQAVNNVLSLEKEIITWSKYFANKEHALFLGRGIHYPIALEGALKLKEVSYIHAEAYPAGELKHGPLALVTDAMPVITVAPNNALIEKLRINMQEVRARGGKLYVFADAGSKIDFEEWTDVIRMPEHYGLLSPILHVIPLQLLAYHTACVRGTDVDKPRNLAKSVTVE